MLSQLSRIRSVTSSLLVAGALLATGCTQLPTGSAGGITTQVASVERSRIERKADAYLQAAPRTVTATRSERSAGGPHDF